MWPTNRSPEAGASEGVGGRGRPRENRAGWDTSASPFARRVVARAEERALQGLLWAVMIALGGCSSVPRAGPPRVKGAERLGIEVVALRLTAADAMLDLRFRVVDPDLATRLVDRSIRPFATREGGGPRLSIPSSPKLGYLRAKGPLLPGHIYYFFFGNPARQVKRGERLHITLGDAVLEGLVVQ